MEETAAWTRAIDSYCERIDPGFWAEPVNAVTNLAFLIGALVAWRAALAHGRSDDWAVRALVLILTAIGVGSFLFHTFANRWSVMTDVIPIMLFILVYLYVILVRYLGLPRWAGGVGILLFFPVSAGISAVLTPLVGTLNGSMGYVPTLILMAAFAALLHARGHPAGRGIAIAAGLLFASLTFRTLDDQSAALCEAFPLGTHFMWHVLNGTLLGWLIVVLARHGAPSERRLAQAGAAS